MGKYHHKILLCAGAGCISCNCATVRDAIEETIDKLGLKDGVKMIETGCIGTCAEGPVMLILPERIFYVRVTPDDVENIIKSQIIDGVVVENKTFQDKTTKQFIPCIDDIPFFREQVRIALRNCGNIEYKSLEAYIANGGYQAAYKALTSMKPEDVVKEVLDSGLRGRGGAGFPTGKKWSLIAPGEQKYIVCNADEGDPGAFMDRSVIEGDPHNLIEGMMLAGYAIGATQGYVYIRAEYPIAVERLNEAIAQAREAGLLGGNVFGTDFKFDLEIRIGAGAFVCGEETALLSSIEGKRGEPRPKPPFPAVSGLYGKPTIINNVETLANIAYIVGNGAAEYSKYGCEGATGTKVFALAGDIMNTGIIEVPIGTTMRKVIYDIGGGMQGGKKFKAAQVGGPSGGCITAENIDVPLEYTALQKLGAIMGSGGLIAMNENTCMVDTARFFTDFTQDESCGKCTACRIGTKRMLEILERITKGEGEPDDIDTLYNLGQVVKDAALCGLGQTAPNPVLSTINNFRDEYEAHINDKRCPAGICKALTVFEVDADLCKGCTKCARNCPVGAISGTVKEAHVIDASMCTGCGVCRDNCAFNAIHPAKREN
ncbi:MAG: NADH-quinone oxidoreductase subunit NuoF [Clostridia bacterium]|nr:NADH-quinone oxidoreductase subunit NuoF [Clostridia bacterium]